MNQVTAHALCEVWQPTAFLAYMAVLSQMPNDFTGISGETPLKSL